MAKSTAAAGTGGRDSTGSMVPEHRVHQDLDLVGGILDQQLGIAFVAGHGARTPAASHQPGVSTSVRTVQTFPRASK